MRPNHALLKLAAASTIAIGGGSQLIGCRDNSPPPPRVPVPTSDNREARITHRDDGMKPLPSPRVDRDELPAPPFDDVPLVNQQPPEQPAFVDAYRKVGAPRIVVFVNRTLEGDIVPVNNDDPILSVEQTRKSNAAVTVEGSSTVTHDHGYHSHTRDTSDRFESKGPAEYRQTTDIYLHPGQYDEADAKTLDYAAIENIMTDWLACNGQVTIISPTMARQRLSDQQVKDLQSGRPQVMSEIAQQLGAEVLVQVQAHPTRQTPQGLEVRVVAEALNIKGGESIGRAVVDMPPPLEKTTINRYTRFLARKLMDGMLGAWAAPPPPDRAAPAPPREGSVPPAPPAPPAPSANEPPPPPPPPPAAPAPLPPPPAPMSDAPTTAPTTQP